MGSAWVVNVIFVPLWDALEFVFVVLFVSHFSTIYWEISIAGYSLMSYTMLIYWARTCSGSWAYKRALGQRRKLKGQGLLFTVWYRELTPFWKISFIGFYYAFLPCFCLTCLIDLVCFLGVGSLNYVVSFCS